MRILVLGGTRFIGRAVVADLLGAGHDVTVFHRGERGCDGSDGARHLHGDRRALDTFSSELRTLAPDVAVDMACMFERDAVEAVRVLRAIAARAMVISSVDVYRAYGRLHGSEPGPLEPLPLSEDAPLRDKLYPYRGEEANPDMDDYDKIPVERAYLSDPELPGAVVRLPAVHGEHDYQRRLFMEAWRFHFRRPYILLQSEAASWAWPRASVANVARAIAVVATNPATAARIYNAPVDPPMTQRQWLERCASVTGWPGEIIEIPGAALPEHLRQPINFAQSMIVKDSRARAELPYTDVISTDEGIRRAIEWELSHDPPRPGSKVLDFDAEDATLTAYRARGA
jgi:nucleoside-diphosphate-sugar epimerase